MLFTHLSSKLFYAILLSPVATRHSVLASFHHVLMGDNSIQDRIVFTVSLVDSLIPGIAKKLSCYLYERNRFPWLPVLTTPCAYGTGSAVFKVNWPGGDKALRIYRKSLGKSTADLWEVARYYKSKYETILAWYGGASDLVLPMEFLVVQGLPLVGPVAISLQPYVQGRKHDLFDDFSDEELLKLFEENPFLREQFIFFAEQTIHQWNGGKECYDLLGHENIVVVEDGGEFRLRIIDVGCFRLDTLGASRVEKMTRLEQRIGRMLSLLQRTKKFPDGLKIQYLLRMHTDK